ncbi:MAG TPA: L,D-transpeptidase [Methylovirgula sp.]|nr:L,D-transpeptidase [Methylovirgula sp.]
MRPITRRTMLTGASAAGLSLALAGCVTTQPSPVVEADAGPPTEPLSRSAEADYTGMYGPVNDTFPIPAVKLSELNQAFLRREVAYQTNEPVGTIVVDPQHHYLYHVRPGGRAMRYGVGVGREGFAWSGIATIHDKQEWPDWYPPPEMFARQPDIKKYMSDLQSGQGMPGGPQNPLGARAMYLWENNKDTLYRIHGTNEPWTIGTSVSSGCIRMINQDVIDLYNQTSVGTKVVVLGPGVVG